MGEGAHAAPLALSLLPEVAWLGLVGHPELVQRLHRRRAYAEIGFAVRERASATLVAPPLLVEAAQSRFVFLHDFPARPRRRERCWRRRRRRGRRQEMPGAPRHGRA